MDPASRTAYIAGSSFGVVTSFEFALHPMQREVVAGEIVFPLERARDVLSFYSEFMHTAPDDLYCDCFINAPLSGEGAGAGLSVCYSGAAAGADKALAPIRKLGEPNMFTNVSSVDYVDAQRSWDDTDPRNEGEYLKGGFINAFPEELVTRLADGFEPDPRRSTMLYFQHSGGAIGRVASDATAFAHRKSMASTPMRCPMRRSESSTAIIRAITSACCRSRIATIRITCSG